MRLLFVPVSGAFGMGEYARSLSIARAASERWPEAKIRFLLSKQAPYAAGAPFAATLLPSSPTFHSPEVLREINEFRPHIVIFDNAGRTAQLRAARRCGARIVYISARARQRAKAFRLRWMRLIDEHWIAYPKFTAGPLSPWERLKLRALRRPAVRYLDVILARAKTVKALPEATGTFVLMVPGGGTGHPGAQDAITQFQSAARVLAGAGTPTILVGVAGAQADSGSVPLHEMAALPQAELIELMRAARLVIANGGSTLLQAIACGCACVAVPIAGDQQARIDACVAAGVAKASALDAVQMAAVAQRLLRNDAERVAMAARAVALNLADGVQIAVDALAAMLADPKTRAAAAMSSSR